jgi:hypothetical protein
MHEGVTMRRDPVAPFPCQVLRTFTGDGRQLSAGDIVDAGSWRHADNLIERRYLRPVADVAPKTRKEAPRG